MKHLHAPPVRDYAPPVEVMQRVSLKSRSATLQPSAPPLCRGFQLLRSLPKHLIQRPQALRSAEQLKPRQVWNTDQQHPAVAARKSGHEVIAGTPAAREPTFVLDRKSLPDEHLSQTGECWN